jgi:DNA-binding transcriptional ArsR family regulator
VTTRRSEEDVELWAAIGEPSRRMVLDVLLAHGQATATFLAGELPVTRQAVAKHLAVLERAGLVEGRRHGREMRYAVRPERLDEAAQTMTRLAARWDSRLQAIKRLAEAAHDRERRDARSRPR